MAVGNVYFYLFTALLAIHFIFAEENQENNDEKNRWSVGFSFHRSANDSRHNHTRFRPPRPSLFFPNISRCDYNSEAGFSCSGCSTVRVCLSNNVSISRNCGILLPYCDNGRCAPAPSASCNGSSTE